MRILVIGGTKFFGKRLVRKLLAAGEHVSVLSRGNEPLDFEGDFEHLRADRSERSELSRVAGGRDWDVVYDQVCMTAGQARRACEVFRGHVGHYVMTSTLSVYPLAGNLSEEDFRPERYEFLEEVPQVTDAKSYGEAKRQAEALFSREGGFPLSIPRFPVVVGEDDYTRRLFDHVKRVAEGRPFYFPAPDARFAFVEAGDAAEALAKLRHLPQGTGPVNVASPDAVRLRDLMNEIGRLLRVHALFPSADAGADPSPYGVSGDWFMKTEKAKSLGLEGRPTAEWLPSLLEFMARSL